MAGMINTDETFCLYMDDIVKTEETVKDEPMEQIGDDFENAIWNCLENTNGCSEDDILKAVCRSPLMVMLPAFVEGEGGPPETLTSLEQDLFAVVEGENAGSTLPLQIKKELPQPVIEQVHGVDLDDRGSPKVLMEVGRIEPASTTSAVQAPAVAPKSGGGNSGGGGEGSGGGNGSNVDRPDEPTVLHVAVRTPGVDKSFHCSCGKVYRHSGSLSKHIRVLRNRLTNTSTPPNQTSSGNGGTLNTAVTQASESMREISTTNANVNHNTIDMQHSELSVTSSLKEVGSGQNFALNSTGFQGGHSINDGNPSSIMQTNVTTDHSNSLAAISPPSQVQVNRTANMNVQCNMADMQHRQLEVATPQVNKDSSGQNYALNSIGFQGSNKIVENGSPISNVQSNKVVGLCNSLSTVPHPSQVQTIRTANMVVQGNMTDMQFGQLKIATPQPIKASNGQTFAHDPRVFHGSNSTINNGNPITNVQSIKTENHDSSFAAVPPLSNFSSLLSTIHLANSTEQNGMRNTNVESNMNVSQYNSPVTTPYVIQANTGQVAHTSPVQNGMRNTALDHNIIASQYSSLAANPHVNHYSSAHMSTPIPTVQDTNTTGQNGMRSTNTADRHYTKLVTVPHASQASNGHVSALTTAVQVNAGQNATRNTNLNCNQNVGQYNSIAAIPHVSQIATNGFSRLDGNSRRQNGMSNTNVENNMTANQYSSVVASPLGGQTVSGGYASAPANAALNSYSTGQNGMGNAYAGSNLTDRHYSPHVDSSSVSQASRGHVNMLLTGVQGSSSTVQNGMSNVTDRQYTTLETVPHASQTGSGLMNALASAVRDTNSCVQNGTRLSNVESNMTGRHYTTLPMNQVSRGHVSIVTNAVQGSNSSGQNDTKSSNIENSTTNKHYTMLQSVPLASQNNSGYINALPPNVQNSNGTNQNRMRITKVENNMTVSQYSSVASQANRAPTNIVHNSNSTGGNEMKSAPPAVGRQIKQEWQPPEKTGVVGKCSNPIEKVAASADAVRGTTNVPVNNQVIRNNNLVVKKTVYDRKLWSGRVPSSMDAFSKNSKLPASEGSGYNCFCGISFQKLPTLLAHVETHSREEFELYSTQAILNIKDSAPKETANSCSDTTVKCSTCGIWFENNVQLNLHMESHVKIDCNEQTILNIEEDNFISSSNNNSFKNTKVSLGHSVDNAKKRHISNERTYQCAVCDKSFREFTDLMMHLEIHQKNVTDNQEAVISKGWNEARNRCVREMPESHDALNYQCGLCKKRFKKLRYLTSHMRIHTKATCPQKPKRPSEPMVHGNANLSTCDGTISIDPAKRMKTTQDPFTQQTKFTDKMPSSCSDSIPLRGLNHLQNNMHVVNSKNTIRPNHPLQKTISTMERGTSTHPDGGSTTGGPPSVRVEAVLTGKNQEVKRTTKENTKENHHNAGSPLSAISVTEAADPIRENKTFTCICGMVFRTSSALAAHTNDHIGRREYFCEICGKLFKQKCILLSHLRYHSYQKAYKCVKCNKSFERHSDFMAHKRLFRVNVSCCICRKKMTRAVCGPNHVFPFQNKRFLCVDCDGSTLPNDPESIRDKLGRYTRKHSNSSGVVDEQIGDKVESEAAKSRLSCTICKSVFTDSKSLLVHSHSHLSECAVILERLNTSEIYKQSYSGGKNEGTAKVVSSQPSKGSAQGDEISSRPSKAVGKKSFAWKCRCGGVFQWRSSMKKHLCKFTGHQCVVCRRLFRRFASLRDHMRSHTGRRKYKCTSCSESFSRLRDLEVHERSHSKEAPVNVEVCEESPQTEPQEARKGSEEPSEPGENQGSSHVNTSENDNPANVNSLQTQGPNCIGSLANEGSSASFPENHIIDGAEQPTETACSPSGGGKENAFECKMEEDCGPERSEIQSHQQCNVEKTTVSDNVNSQPCFGQQPVSSECVRLGEDQLTSVNVEQFSMQCFDKPPKELQRGLCTEDSNSKTDSIKDTLGELSRGSSPTRCHSVPVEYINVRVKQENSLSNEDLPLNPREKENESGSGRSNDGQSTSLQVGCEFEVESKYNPKTTSSDLKSNGSDCIKKEPAHTQPTEKQFLNVETGGDSVSCTEVNREAVNCEVISPQNNRSQDAVQSVGEQASKNKDLIVHLNKHSASNVEIEEDCNVVDGFVRKQNFFQVCKREPDAQPMSPAECEKAKDSRNNSTILGTSELEKHTSKRAALVDLISDESGDEDQQVNPGSCEHPPKRHCPEKSTSDLCEQSSKTPNSSPKVYQICDSEEETEDRSKSQSDDIMVVEETNKQKISPPEVYEISDSDDGEEKESNHQCLKAQSDFVDQGSTHLHSKKTVKCEEGPNSAHDDLNQSSEAETSPFACDICMKPFPDSDALQVHKHIWGKVPCNINKWRNTTQTKQTAQTGTATIGNAGTLKQECTMGEELRPSSAPERIQSPCESLRECSCSEEKTQCCCKSKCQRQQHQEKGSGGHVCRACGKSFAQKDFLIDHLHEHIDGRKYRCKYCHKTFQRSVKLAVHKLRCSQRKMSAQKVKPASDDDDVESNKGTSFPRSFAVPFVGVQPQTVPMLVSVPVLVSRAMTWGNIVTLR